jgi:hypothetical protein
MLKPEYLTLEGIHELGVLREGFFIELILSQNLS